MFTEHFGLKSSGGIRFYGLYAFSYNDEFKRSYSRSVGSSYLLPKSSIVESAAVCEFIISVFSILVRVLFYGNPL